MAERWSRRRAGGRSSPPATRPIGSRRRCAALRATFPGASIWVADDASDDGTAEVAMAAGAQVVSRGRPHGKGANVTAAVEAALGGGGAPRDRPALRRRPRRLGRRARRRWSPRSSAGSATSPSPPSAGGSAVASGSRVGFARWAIRRLCGFEAAAPISGQRALRVEALRAALPVRPRLRDGVGDDRRRRPRRLPGARVRARPRAPGDRAETSPASPTAAASCRLQPGVSGRRGEAEGRDHELGRSRAPARGARPTLPATISCWITAQIPPPSDSDDRLGTVASVILGAEEAR